MAAVRVQAKEPVSTLHIHRQSAFLVGRERKVPTSRWTASCSGQHAVLQFRLRERADETGPRGARGQAA